MDGPGLSDPNGLYLTVRTPGFRDPVAARLANPFHPVGVEVAARFAAGEVDADAVFRPDLEMLRTWVVHDGPDGRAHPLTEDDLARHGLSYDRAIAIATEGAAGILEPGGGVTIRPVGRRGRFDVVGPPSRCAALLARPDLLEPWRPQVPGELLVLAPASDVVTLAGSAADDIAEAVAAATTSFRHAGRRRLSPVPYVVARGRLSPWTPTPGTRQSVEVREAEVAACVVTYADFGPTLTEYVGYGVDVVTMAERGESASTGMPFSCTRASLLGHAVYLPFVEYLGFEDLYPFRTGEWAWIPFSALDDVFGDYLVPSWHYGVPGIAFDRERGNGWLGEWSTALRNLAVDPWA